MSFILAGSFSSCEKDKVPALKGTKWKLVSVEDKSTKEPTVRELAPIDCEECYTLTFDTDYTATAHSINETLPLDLRQPLCDSCFLDYLLTCEKYPLDGEYYCDSDRFCRGIIAYGSYTVDNDGLRLFVHKNYNELYCLIFKLIE